MKSTTSAGNYTAASLKEGRAPAWVNPIALLVCLLAGAVVFLPLHLTRHRGML